MYNALMLLGKRCGCHQLPERSFFINGRQFPVCARCTGVLIGSAAAYLVFFLYELPLKLSLIGCAVMFSDWFVQYIGLLPSTNTRRLVTGMIGGYSLATIYCSVIRSLVKFLI